MWGDAEVAKIQFEGREFEVPAGKTVLETLEDAHMDVDSGCRSGSCHRCLLAAAESDHIPQAAQRGLSDSQRQRGEFLACCCAPSADLAIRRIGDSVAELPAFRGEVVERQELSKSVVRLAFTRPAGFDYLSGQFINITHGEMTRAYSLASIAQIDRHLMIHIRRVPDGAMSNWLCDQVAVGDLIDFSAAMGDSVYRGGRSRDGLLLAATGTGLAPMWAILRDAMYQGHAGPIRVYHGGRSPEQLYMVESLRTLAASRSNIQYQPVLKEPSSRAGFRNGLVEEVIAEDFDRLEGWRVYVAGNPDMVNAVRKRAFLLDAKMSDIHADPFVRSAAPLKA